MDGRGNKLASAAGWQSWEEMVADRKGDEQDG